MAINTQTGLALSLYMDLMPEGYRKRTADDLLTRMKKDGNRLKTGFVGTPLLCNVLSENGGNDTAYTLLLNKDYPSWLYAVEMGATTMWERWNSILPDGTINPEDMNSLNHYAYGSIVEWMYQSMAGINPVEEKPGFKQAKLSPRPDYRLKFVKASLNSAAGLYESSWEIQEDGKLQMNFKVPFDASAVIELPDAKIKRISLNGKPLQEFDFLITQCASSVLISVRSGSWEFVYPPEKEYIKSYSVQEALNKLINNKQTNQILEDMLPQITALSDQTITNLGQKTLEELALSFPLLRTSKEKLDLINDKLKLIKMSFID
jgi:alpha-L-rhamnosidase